MPNDMPFHMINKFACTDISMAHRPSQNQKTIPEKIPCPVITLLINLHLCGSGGDVPSRALLGHEAARGSA